MKHGIAALAIFAMVAGGFTVDAAAQAKCTDCGVVQSIHSTTQKGQGSGVGLIAGGVGGGVLGHQIGGGRGKTLATVAGAGAGAYAGNQVEKNAKKTTTWSVAIKMDAGQMRTFTYSSQPTVREGERVKLIDGGRRLALVAK